ncbi:MAG TPA: VWA domain-containing protein [Candidatus Goldiibacteriota bacterium]|nr:VWA domain-containing protein [Candidatus Goldiibacteriota bacterium]
MKYGNPEVFRLLFVLVPLALYFVYRLAVIFINLGKFLDKKTAEKVMYPVSRAQAFVKYGLLILSLFLILVAAARPLGKPIEQEQRLSGIDIMLVLDVSYSMFAIDLQPNRMEVVRNGMREFLSRLSGDRVGMIVFAGTDFVQCPLTNDYEAVEMILDSLTPGMLPKEGTALGDVIYSAVERMEEKAEKSRIMMLITDGEGTIGKNPLDAARKAKEKGIRIYAIGVGTEQGGRIPEGQDVFGRVYFKTYQGQVVVSRLEDAVLRQVAGITDGKYFRVTDKNAFSSINADIRRMEENKAKVKKQVQYEENYGPYLFWGILLFVLSHLVPVRKVALPKIPGKNQ